MTAKPATGSSTPYRYYLEIREDGHRLPVGNHLGYDNLDDAQAAAIHYTDDALPRNTVNILLCVQNAHVGGDGGSYLSRIHPPAVRDTYFGYTPNPKCDNCYGTGIFAGGTELEWCIFCLEEAIKAGKIAGTIDGVKYVDGKKLTKIPMKPIKRK